MAELHFISVAVIQFHKVVKIKKMTSLHVPFLGPVYELPHDKTNKMTVRPAKT